MDQTTYNLASLIVQIAASIGVIGTLFLIWNQVKEAREATRLNTLALEQNAKAVELNAFSCATSNLTEIGKLFVEKDQLRKYYYHGVPVPKNSADYESAEAIAVMMLDFMDNILFYVKNYPELFPEDQWHSYIDDMFNSSPIIRDVLNQLRLKGKNWYDPDITRIMFRVHPNLSDGV